jgi:DNA polymerase-3 subunit epsilon
VYLFRDRAGSVLYIGKATDLRSRVRSYFSSDDRRKIGPMLREASSIEHHPCGSALEAGVLEARLLHALRPRYNRQGTRWDRAAYVRLDTSEAWPRLVVARSAKVPARAAARGSGVVLGPLPSAGTARLAVEAVEEVAPLRRCPERLGRALFAVRESPCTSAQLGVAHCPCAGEVDEGAYLTVVDHVRRGLTGEPHLLLDPLADRIAALARQQRFEEAAAVRDRAAALSDAITRTRRFDALRATGHLSLELPGGHLAELEHGILRSSTAPGALPGTAGPIGRGLVDEPPAVGPPGTPLPPEAAHELLATAGFLDRYAGRVRITDLSGRWSSPLPRLPSFRPAGNRPSGPTV